MPLSIQFEPPFALVSLMTRLLDLRSESQLAPPWSTSLAFSPMGGRNSRLGCVTKMQHRGLRWRMWGGKAAALAQRVEHAFDFLAQRRGVGALAGVAFRSLLHCQVQAV